MTDLPERFGRHVREGELLEPGWTVVVAVSGGLDSVALLHLLRFHPPVPELHLVAGHVDHGMRRESRADGDWVRGLARAWRVETRVRRLAEPPASEAEARRARYAALDAMVDEAGARALLTAHHADDQAETVLFRAVRGTGIRGLGGMAAKGPDLRVRPLLPFWRREVERYGRVAGLGWRRDPTNRDPAYARNVLRHEVLPRLEAEVSPAARRALVRLARHARSDEAGWASLLPTLLEGVVEEVGEDRIVVARDALLAYHSAVRARVLRELVRRFGTVLDEGGTRALMEFTRAGSSGGRCHLAGGVTLWRSFDRFVLARGGGGEPGPERSGPSVVIPRPGSGEAVLGLGPRSYRVVWRRDSPAPDAPFERFSTADLRFPLQVRSWRPGDRIRLGYGSKKLKKLFGEARVSTARRSRVPILVDAAGRVLWVAGLARAETGRVDEDTPFLAVGIADAED